MGRLLVALALAGCTTSLIPVGDDDEDGDPFEPRGEPVAPFTPCETPEVSEATYFVRPSPPDLANGVAVPYRVELIAPGGVLPADVIAEVRERVSLVAWAEGDAIEAELVERALDGEPGIALEFQSDRFPDRWLGLRVRKLPADVAIDPGACGVFLSDGSFVSRFRPGLEAEIDAVRVCGDQVTVELEQGVRGGGELLTVTQADTTCEGGGAVEGRALAATCALDTAAAFTVSLAEGLVTLRRSVTLPGQSLEIDPSSLVDEDGCRVYRR